MKIDSTIRAGLLTGYSDPWRSAAVLSLDRQPNKRGACGRTFPRPSLRCRCEVQHHWETNMPRLKRSIPVARLGKLWRFDISTDDWRRIEGAYRRRLSDLVRRELEGETRNFLGTSMMEKKAAPVGDAKETLRRIRTAAASLGKTIPAITSANLARVYARNLLHSRLRTPESWDDPHDPAYFQDPLADLATVLVRLAAACDNALAQLNDPDFSIGEGEGWRRWIIRITEILKRHSLPTGVRKDGLGRPSAFVMLVREIQKRLPSEHRRHVHSTAAAAKAIQMARRAAKPRANANQ